MQVLQSLVQLCDGTVVNCLEIIEGPFLANWLPRRLYTINSLMKAW